MNWLTTSIHTHPTYWTLGVYIVVSNFLSSLPMPDATSSKLYGFFFKFANGLGSNLPRAFAGKIPGTADVMPIPGAQDALNKAAVVAKAAEIGNPVVVEPPQVKP
jgi:hypothetical protein